jgi:hypothetical protein
MLAPLSFWDHHFYGCKGAVEIEISSTKCPIVAVIIIIILLAHGTQYYLQRL